MPHIYIATPKEFPDIRKIWEERFPAEKEYQDIMFSEIIPLCTNYIIKERKEGVISVNSLMPMKFINEERNVTLNGWYMFGVATKSGFEGNGYASALINHATSKLERDNYDFIFERPANQVLINFYLKFGFTKLLKKQKYSIQHHQKSNISSSNNSKSEIKTISNQILTEIRNNFKIRFEWADPKLLTALIKLGEAEQHNGLQTHESLQEECYIAIRPLNSSPEEVFDNAFFCFPME